MGAASRRAVQLVPARLDRRVRGASPAYGNNGGGLFPHAGDITALNGLYAPRAERCFPRCDPAAVRQSGRVLRPSAKYERQARGLQETAERALLFNRPPSGDLVGMGEGI